MKFRVVLEIRMKGGTAIGSTDDVFEAPTPSDAEAIAIAAWTSLDPANKYAPLLTISER